MRRLLVVAAVCGLGLGCQAQAEQAPAPEPAAAHVEPTAAPADDQVDTSAYRKMSLRVLGMT